MDPKKVEEELRKIVQSLDKGVHLEAALEEEGKWAAILSKGSHSDRASLSGELLEGFLSRGEGAKELHKALGKVIGKLNRHGPEAAVTAGEIIPPVFHSRAARPSRGLDISPCFS